MQKSDRIKNELKHGKYLVDNNAESVWHWSTKAGVQRYNRRCSMLCNSVKKGDVVLEVGCGTGLFTKELAKKGAGITAIDISPDLIKYASTHNLSENIRYSVQDIHNTHYSKSSFDYIIGSSVLHHLDVSVALKEIYRILNDGGEIFFTEPNMLNPQIAIERNLPYMREIFGNSPDETAFVRFTLEKKLREIGYVDIDIYPFDFLHPSIPEPFIKLVDKIGSFLEKILIIKEIAGSLYIHAKK